MEACWRTKHNSLSETGGGEALVQGTSFQGLRIVLSTILFLWSYIIIRLTMITVYFCQRRSTVQSLHNNIPRLHILEQQD
jgi:mannose/fructose/N-acetylgalactosamine-specific phosphotransferase system component IIC